jgi:hypothetical protein
MRGSPSPRCTFHRRRRCTSSRRRLWLPGPRATAAGEDLVAHRQVVSTGGARSRAFVLNPLTSNRTRRPPSSADAPAAASIRRPPRGPRLHFLGRRVGLACIFLARRRVAAAGRCRGPRAACATQTPRRCVLGVAGRCSRCRLLRRAPGADAAAGPATRGGYKYGGHRLGRARMEK